MTEFDLDKAKSFVLAGFLDALMLLSQLEIEDDPDPDELTLRKGRAWAVITPQVVMTWQILSDEAQQQFLADYPEHEQAVPALLMQFATGAGVDMADMTTATRYWQGRMKRLHDEAAGE